MVLLLVSSPHMNPPLAVKSAGSQAWVSVSVLVTVRVATSTWYTFLVAVLPFALTTPSVTQNVAPGALSSNAPT